MSELYHERILALAQAAHGAGRLDNPSATAVVHNPLCGDRVSLQVCVESETLTDIAQAVRGCLLCEASASWLGLRAVGQSRSQLRVAASSLADLMAGATVRWQAPFDELAMFEPVSAYRSRHRCVLLPFEALEQALSRLAEK